MRVDHRILQLGTLAFQLVRYTPIIIVVENGYRFHDLMLGRLMALAGPDCAVMVVSDHGFHSDKLLPDYIPAENAGPAVEHRSFGIFCMSAPGVRAGVRVYGASVLDIAPTALHVLGLAAGLDMDGKVLVNAFADDRPVEKIESWDAVAGEDGELLRFEDLLPSPDAGPEALYARGVFLDELESAMDDLPAEQRDVFVAHEIEGRSFKEIAAGTGVSENTLISRKHYAVLRLRERLQSIYDEFTKA